MAKIALLLLILFSSCIGNQKKLQRRIEKNGIKESIAFVQTKYPEYFKTVAITVHDTIAVHDTIITERHLVDTVLQLDTGNVFKFENERLKIRLNRLTGQLNAEIKHDTIFVSKEIPISIKCPELICADVLIKKTRVNWLYVCFAFLLGLVFLPLFRQVS